MGIAKVKKAAEATVTSVNKGPGTFPYMAPEMFKSGQRGPAVDIYSLGCLFIELLGRKHVWADLDATAIMMKVVGSYDTPLKCQIHHTSAIRLVDFVQSCAKLMQTSTQTYRKFCK